MTEYRFNESTDDAERKAALLAAKITFDQGEESLVHLGARHFSCSTWSDYVDEYIDGKRVARYKVLAHLDGGRWIFDGVEA